MTVKRIGVMVELSTTVRGSTHLTNESCSLSVFKPIN
jgi:hypothetical protein